MDRQPCLPCIAQCRKPQPQEYARAMNWIYPLGFLIIFFIVALLIQQWLLKRALNQVVAIFQKNRATTRETARTLEELNLQPLGFLRRPAAFRNFNHRVVETLSNTGIVIVTEDQRYYLSESALAKSPLGQMLNTPPSN